VRHSRILPFGVAISSRAVGDILFPCCEIQRCKSQSHLRFRSETKTIIITRNKKQRQSNIAVSAKAQYRNFARRIQFIGNAFGPNAEKRSGSECRRDQAKSLPRKMKRLHRSFGWKPAAPHSVACPHLSAADNNPVLEKKGRKAARNGKGRSNPGRRKRG